MTADDERLASPTYMGFQKWIKLPVDDFPLIQPPKQHMLAHVTGGLTELYKTITDDKEKKEKELLEANEIEKEKKAKDDQEEKMEVENGTTEASPTSLLHSQESKKGKDEKIEAKPIEEKEVNDTDKEKSKTKKKDDEGGGQDFIDGEDPEEEETSPYTDEEGEFAPEEGIPLLASRYKFVEVLARGQSALIVKALDTFSKDKPVAIKVLHRIYKPIGSQEADILLELHRADPWLHVPFARLQNQFIYGPHYCLVFDFLSPTPLYNHYDQKNIRGPASLPHVRNLCVKLLTVMGFLHKQNVIHADLKPENILLLNEEDMSSVMVIDFGNALRNTEEELSLYYTDFELQTLLYRAPEVIFGLKFSLEIDMWSLGCLLAECYTGEPLFMGKTKEDILAKMTKLLGPFPIEFNEGECADLFSEFIGRPLNRYQRVENLRKRLNNCQDINFLLLLENLLTYLPDKRISPFEAACHPFIASVNPFLYLSSSNELKRYPTVVLDMSTYPYFPGLPDENSLDQTSLDGRRRLASYSRSSSLLSSLKVPDPKETKVDAEQHAPEKPKQANKPEPKENQVNSTVDETPPPTSLSQPSSPQHVQSVQSVQSQPKSVSPTRTPSTASTPPVSTSPLTLQPSETKSPPQKSPKSPQPDPTPSPHSTQTKGEKRVVPPPTTKEETVKQTKGQGQGQNQGQNQQGLDPGGSFSRTDVKQTLKSMGLRCEDFTISVYSREQAHAILRKQGVEVTNHQPPKQSQQSQQPPPQQQQQQQQQQQPPPPPPSPSPSQQPAQQQAAPTVQPPSQSPSPSPSQPPSQPQPQTTQGQPTSSKSTPRPSKTNPSPATNIRPSVSVLRSEPSRPQPPPPPASKVDDDDDDDDCVILDPPEGPKPPPPPPRRFPQQFQLMGTTVQVNRGSKRQMRSMPHAPMPKRVHASRYYYNEGYPYEESPEASVQDTLKRLKNYNISITCRRNSAQRHPRMHTMDSDSSDMDHDGSHLDSEDEEDMAKYLECEIDEEKEQGMDPEGDEMLDLDSSGSVNDVSPERVVERRLSKMEKRKLVAELEEAERLNSTVEIDDDDKENEEINSESDVKDDDNKETEEVTERVITGDDGGGGMDGTAESQTKISEEQDHEKEPSEAILDWDGGGDGGGGGEGGGEDDTGTGTGEGPSTLSDDNANKEQGPSRKGIQSKSDTLITESEIARKSAKSPENENITGGKKVPTRDKIDPTPIESRTIGEIIVPIPSTTFTHMGLPPESASAEEETAAETKIATPLAEPFKRIKGKEDAVILEEKRGGERNFEDDTAGRDMCDNLDDDINEELEKQLLEAGNLDDDDFEGEDMEGEGLDNLDLENEL